MRELNRGPLDFKSSTLRNELKRYPTSAVLVVVLVSPTITEGTDLGDNLNFQLILLFLISVHNIAFFMLFHQ